VPLTTTAGGKHEIGPKVVEGLLTYDEELRPKPLLATAWSVSKDGLQYRFELRRGVKWHDGATSRRPTWRSRSTPQAGAPARPPPLCQRDEVRTPDAHTAVIVLSKPSPFLLTALAAAESPIVPKHLWKAAMASKYNSAPVGTGPVFKEWVQAAT
jgi:peptide/nickel transport system substrate-binding protein